MDKKRILRYVIVISAFALLSILIIVLNKFNFNVNYSKNVRLELNLSKSFEVNDIIGITSEVYNNQIPIVRSVGEFGETVAITVKDSTDEQNEQLIKKINEKYETEFAVEDLKIYYNSNVKGTDILSPYIIPSIISGLLILAFFAIRYRKLGIAKIMGVVLGTVLGTTLLYMALNSLFAMEVNEASIAGGLCVELFCVIYIAASYEKVLNQK